MEDNEDDYLSSPRAMSLATFSTVVAVLVSIASIYQHLVNYTCPDQQRYIIRLLFTCPLYAVTSLLSLTDSQNAIFYETVRDCYESLVIYSFMVLILEYAGGEANCVTKMQGRPPLPYPFPGCWLAPRPRTVDLLRECKRGTLQFVVLKPLLGMLSMIMVGAGAYNSAGYQTFLLIVYNVAYTVALYYLLLFYLATKEACEKHRPVTKFVAVKAVVFFTYYQSIGIRLLPNMTPEEAQSWGDFILCVEMIMFSLMLGGAFGAAPYDQSSSGGGSSSNSSRNGGGNGGGGSVGMSHMGSGSSGSGLGAHRTGAVEGGGLRGVLTNDGRQQLLSNARNALTVRDIVADTYHNFASKYQDYALQTEERDDGLFVGSQRSTLSRHALPHHGRSSLSKPSGKGASSSSSSSSFLGHALELPNAVASRMGIFDSHKAFKAARDARRRRQRSRLPADITGNGQSAYGSEDGARELYFIGVCWGVETSLYLCVEPRALSINEADAVEGAASASNTNSSALMKEDSSSAVDGAAAAAAAAASTTSDACVCHGEGLNCNGYFEVKGTYRKVYGDFADPSSYVPQLSPQAALSAGDPVAWRAAVVCGGASPPEPSTPPRRVLEGERFELRCNNNHGTVPLVLSRRLGRDDDDDDDVVNIEIDIKEANSPASASNSGSGSIKNGAPTDPDQPSIHQQQQHTRKRERAKFGGALWAQHAAPLVQFHKLAVDLKANIHQAGSTMLRRSRSSNNNTATATAATTASSSSTSIPATAPEEVEILAGAVSAADTYGDQASSDVERGDTGSTPTPEAVAGSSATDGTSSTSGGKIMPEGAAGAAAAEAVEEVAEEEEEEASSGLVWFNLRGLPSAGAGAEDTLELHDLQAVGGPGLRQLSETSAARAAVLARRIKWRTGALTAAAAAGGASITGTTDTAGTTEGSSPGTDAATDVAIADASTAGEALCVAAANMQFAHLAAPLAGSLEEFPPMVIPRGADCSGEGADFEPMTPPEIEAFVQRMAQLDARDNALVFEDDDDVIIGNGHHNGASPSGSITAAASLNAANAARAANSQPTSFSSSSSSSSSSTSPTSAPPAPVVLPILQPPPQPLLRRPRTNTPPLPATSSATAAAAPVGPAEEEEEEEDTFSPFHSSEAMRDERSGSHLAPTIASIVHTNERGVLPHESKPADEEIWDDIPFEAS